MFVRATPEEIAAVRDQFALLTDGVPDLPTDADTTPALPGAGIPAGQWVNASGCSAMEAGALLYVHGGGFAHTEPQSERLLAYHLSKATGRPVFALDYRLAPAHPFPAALQDVLAAHDGLLAQGAAEVALFGESAGGTLVLSALLALEAERRPRAVAVSPVTDLTLSSPSLTANDGRDLINRTVLEQVCAQYLAGAPADAAPQSPLHGQLDGLPPLLLAAGSVEVLADDARRFAAAAQDAGVEVTLDVYEGMPHVFHLAMLTGAPLTTTTTFLRQLADFVTRRSA
ncbi:alpha/beta hydrolase fold domain-containing protein [Nonomuraea helvata]|uniref:Alpha/beta hydrolase fold domain-containing protein n=1 Tax=Nonomuraea helvata TaxID=37484 RepID=A0ABV5SCT7_9ACTN